MIIVLILNIIFYILIKNLVLNYMIVKKYILISNYFILIMGNLKIYIMIMILKHFNN